VRKENESETNSKERFSPSTAPTPKPTSTSTPLPQETQQDIQCPSLGIEPKKPVDKKDYLIQALLFHPDKNPDCVEDATTKFKNLGNLEEARRLAKNKGGKKSNRSKSSRSYTRRRY
jgi:hypothetical protein